MYPRKFWRDSSLLSEEVQRLQFCFISIFLGKEIPRVYSETSLGLQIKRLFLIKSFIEAKMMINKNGALIRVVSSLSPSKSVGLILNRAMFSIKLQDLKGAIATGIPYK